MSQKRINLGKTGEELTAKYLESYGFKIIAKNYSSKYGEIDLIAQKQDVLAFIEVKLRQNKDFYLSELITLSKQRKIIKTALRYIAINNIKDKIFRFDVSLLTYIPELTEKHKINYIKNAFTKLD